MNRKYFIPLVLTLISVLASSCDQQVNDDNPNDVKVSVDKAAITIPANTFVESEGDVANSEGEEAVSVSSDEAALVYDVKVPVAGRYTFEVHASNGGENEAIFWMEDYIDNTDGRTYNVTGNMFAASNSELTSISKDGSPLNKGTHKMKLHIKGANTTVQWVRFTLIREHLPTPESLTQKTNGENWEVVWSDEFDGEGAIDTTKWTYDVGDWGWGNNELQYYTVNRLENARQEGGNLIIEAIKDDMGKPWTSARLTTRGKTSFLYGRIEFRAKVPPNRGNWAAGWTLGDDYVDEKSWPYCGEIDIMESVGYEMNDETGAGKAHASVHCGAYYFKLGNQPTAITDVENMYQEFHTYAIDWTPEGIKAYVDGMEYFSYTDISTELAWPFSRSQDIILNLAMGGGWGGAQGMDENMTRQQLVVDYVRVYELR